MDTNKLKASLKEVFPKFDFIVEVQGELLAIEASFSGVMFVDDQLDEQKVIESIKTYLNE